MDVQPSQMPYREFYRLLITAVVPRPIAWVSTIGKDGVANLAPFSFFNVLCGKPPMVGFCPGIRSADLQQALGHPAKDTLRNTRDTGEFVVNMVPYELAQAMNITAVDYEPEIDEFEMAKLTKRASRIVRPPQVAESPISFECRLSQIVDFGTEKAGGSLVIGEIVSVHLDESVLRNGRIEPDLFELTGRMGGTQYCRTRERFEMPRPEYRPKAAAEKAAQQER